MKLVDILGAVGEGLLAALDGEADKRKRASLRNQIMNSAVAEMGKLEEQEADLGDQFSAQSRQRLDGLRDFAARFIGIPLPLPGEEERAFAEGFNRVRGTGPENDAAVAGTEE